MSLRQRTHDILRAERRDDPVARVVQLFIIGLIVLNVAVVILETVESLERQYGYYFYIFEIFSVIVFTIEYGLRVWSCVENERFSGPVRGRLHFMVTPSALIDLGAILPFYLPRVTAVDLRVLRALRLFRLLRLLKIGRFSRSVSILGGVLREKWEEMVLAALAVGVALVFAASLMYYAEQTAQPEHFSSIPAAMWWGIVTLTTVGYGDVAPITPLGRALGGVIALLGIGLFALPAGILASGFEEAMKRRKKLMHEDEDAKDNAEDDAEDDAVASDEDQHDKPFCPCCGQRLQEEKG